MDPKRYSGPGIDHTVQLVYVLSLQPTLNQAVQQSPCEGSPPPESDPTWPSPWVSYKQCNGTGHRAAQIREVL